MALSAADFKRWLGVSDNFSDNLAGGFIVFSPNLPLLADGSPDLAGAVPIAIVRQARKVALARRTTQAGGKYMSGAGRQVPLAVPVISGTITLDTMELVDLREVENLLMVTNGWVVSYGQWPHKTIAASIGETGYDENVLLWPYNYGVFNRLRLDYDMSVASAMSQSAMLTRDLRVTQISGSDGSNANPFGSAKIEWTAEWPSNRSLQP